MTKIKTYKQFISEASEYGGIDYEASIVMGYYSASGVEPPVGCVEDRLYKKVNSIPALKKDGITMAKELGQKVGLGGTAKQVGASTYSLTPFWKKYGASDNTPKTDIILNGNNISLKVGPSQLMSGKAPESIATFNAALKEVPLSRSKVKPIMDEFGNFVKGVTKKGDIGYAGKHEKTIKEAAATHKRMLELLNNLFNKNPDFKKAFVKEAMSGQYKFGGTEATATGFAIGKKGSGISYHTIQDDGYISKVASLAGVEVRFKTNSTKSKGVKTGKYAYYSVVGLHLSKLKQLEETVSTNEGLLTENVIIDLWNKFTSWVEELYNSVVEWISESWDNLLSFLEIENDDLDISVNTEFQWPT